MLVSSLGGCASLDLWGTSERPIEIVKKPLDKTPLNLPLPEPLRAREIKWVVITPDNAEAVFKQMEARGQNAVLFAITDDGYQELALTMVDIRNMIATQRNMIIKYQEYYEPNKKENKK